MIVLVIMYVYVRPHHVETSLHVRPRYKTASPVSTWIGDRLPAAVSPPPSLSLSLHYENMPIQIY